MPGRGDPAAGDVLAQAPAVLFQLRRRAGEQERFPFVSERVGELLSLTPAELQTSSAPVWALLPADDAARVAEALAVSEAQLTPWEVEFQARPPGQQVKWIAAAALPTRGPDGAILWHGVLSDATERRRTRRVDTMNAIARLAGGVAHELNNLLTAIGSNLDEALGELSPDQAARRYLEQGRHAAGRAADLTRELLAFGQRQVLRLEPLRWNDIIAGAQAAGRLIPTDRHDLTPELRLDHDAATVRADREQLEQVLANLVANAVDAMRSSGRLTIATGRRDVADAEARRRPGMRAGLYAWLTVQDTGSGFDEEIQAHLFEPFFTTKVGSGARTGLGLSTVYGIVKQLDGYVQVESIPGEGTTFTVYLPEVARPGTDRELTGAAPAASTVSRRDGGTVLVAEDEVSVREPVRRVLERFGYRVIDAPDGGTALARAAEVGHAIDLLLTDVMMPGMSGSELARRLREWRPELRVLFMSGYSSEAIASHGVLTPGSAFLQKPFSVTELIDRVRETLATTLS